MGQQPDNTAIVYPNVSYISAMSLFNGIFKIVMTGNQTSNRLTIDEALVYNGSASRCQVHTKEDMVYVVLNGSLQFYLDGYQFCAPADTTVYIPRNVTQSQRNLGSKPVHIQVLFLPSGVENYWSQLIPLLAQKVPNITQIYEIAATVGIQFCPEVEWKDLNCFNSCGVFSLSFHLVSFTILLYVLIFF